MEDKILNVINQIRLSKGLKTLESVKMSDNLRDDLEFTSFDLAELTVHIEDEFDIDVFEDGIVNTVGEIYSKLKDR